MTLTREYGTRMQSELRRQREKKRIADRSVLDTVTDIDTTQSNDDGSSSQRLTGSADAAPRRRKRPPPLSSVVRGGWIRKEAEKGADKGSARVGPSRKDKKVVQRSNVYDMSAPTSMSAPTIMTAPSIVTGK